MGAKTYTYITYGWWEKSPNATLTRRRRKYRAGTGGAGTQPIQYSRGLRGMVANWLYQASYAVMANRSRFLVGTAALACPPLAAEMQQVDARTSWMPYQKK